MNSWQLLKAAETRARAEEERLCTLYNCYPWEINYERKKAKNRRREVLPFIYRHIDNGVEIDDDELRDLLLRHGEIEETTAGELEIDLEELSPELLEELLQLYIRENNKKKSKTAEGQRM